MAAPTLIEVYTLVAKLPHLATYTVAWFLLLTALDLGKYVGRVAAFSTLVHKGQHKDRLSYLQPATMKAELYGSVRLNLMLVLYAWTVLYFFSQTLTFAQFSGILAALYLFNSACNYLLTLLGFHGKKRD